MKSNSKHIPYVKEYNEKGEITNPITQDKPYHSGYSDRVGKGYRKRKRMVSHYS